MRVFEDWGCPGALRVDNGRPLGDPGSDLISVLALWLIGKHIAVLWNRARCPKDNAKVERMQAVTANWAEPARCQGPEELAQRLEEVAYIQRSLYPVRRLQGQTRTTRYPGLLSKGRPYDPDRFDLARVLAFLGQGDWIRKVSKAGQIDFYHQRWSVGTSWSREKVWVKLDRETAQWCVHDEKGNEIKRFAADFLSAESICGLCLSAKPKPCTS